MREGETMRVRRQLFTVVAATLLSVGVVAPLAAQGDLPTSPQGAQFGNWGPNAGPPEPQTAIPADRSFIAPVGQPLVPAPQLWSGCGFFLGGTWSIAGTQDQPSGFNYTANLEVTQFGQWIQANMSMAGILMQYFGRCVGNQLRFDLYANGRLVGYQNGTINWTPRWNTLNANFRWNVWNTDFATGTEDWVDRWFN
jgi:hypothetical protein